MIARDGSEPGDGGRYVGLPRENTFDKLVEFVLAEA